MWSHHSHHLATVTSRHANREDHEEKNHSNSLECSKAPLAGGQRIGGSTQMKDWRLCRYMRAIGQDTQSPEGHESAAAGDKPGMSPVGMHPPHFARTGGELP